MASRRCAITSAERPWGSRKKVSRVERRARGTALRVGQRLRRSPNRSVSWSCNQWSAWGKEFFQGAREPVGEPPCVTAHTPTVCDAWCQSAPGGALWCEGLQPVAVGAQPCALECGIGGGILGVAGGNGLRASAGSGAGRARGRGSRLGARQRPWAPCCVRGRRRAVSRRTAGAGDTPMPQGLLACARG